MVIREHRSEYWAEAWTVIDGLPTWSAHPNFKSTFPNVHADDMKALLGEKLLQVRCYGSGDILSPTPKVDCANKS